MSDQEELADFSQLPSLANESIDDEEELWYVAHMKARENAYEHIFGSCDPPDTIMSPDDPNLMVNWPGGGIFKFPPRDGRASWHFVTHGLSQPFDEEDQADLPLAERRSGVGFELVLSTRENCDWPANVLLNLVHYLLFSREARPILPGHRLPCNGPLVAGTSTMLTYLMARSSPHYTHKMLLPGGSCQLVHLVGITTDEFQHAKNSIPGIGGSLVLARVLEKCAIDCDSLPNRASLTERDDFAATWAEAQVELGPVLATV